MASYRLLFFRANRLERWEEIEAEGFAKAVEEASRRVPADWACAELWQGSKRLATFKSRRAKHYA